MKSIECLKIIEANRRAAGMRLKEMCLVADISTMHYRECLRGKRSIGADKLLALTEVFELDFRELIKDKKK